MENNNLQTATFASGCFWCTEAVFQRLKGVHSAVSGYTGGHIENPTYNQINYEDTGHAEAVQIEYDPEDIDYKTLLDVFWYTHDPTTLNRQGNDVGEQYRSAIFYHDKDQKRIAEQSKEELEKENVFDDPIVTEIIPAEKFFEAEEYHQGYYDRNPDAGYCRIVIDPKVAKLKESFEHLLAKEED